MQVYGDIIERIAEIIRISEQKKSELSKEELKDYNNLFVKILWKDVAVEYADEFRKLLNAERTFYLLGASQKNKESNIEDKNVELLEMCKKRGSIDNEFTEDYLKLLSILNDSFGKTPGELTEYLGYFIPNEELAEFLAICRKLKVGPCVTLKDINIDEAKKAVDSNLNHKKEQNKRINSYLTASQIVSFEQSANIVSGESISEDHDIFTSLNGPLSEKALQYKELIYLGITGKLSIDMVVELKNILTDQEFNTLLSELKKWQIFEEKDFQNIKNMAYSTEKPLNDIDELIGFLVLRKDLNVDALRLLIPYIGIDNYHYIIDQLFKFGVIDFNAYKDHLEKTFNIRLQ